MEGETKKIKGGLKELDKQIQEQMERYHFSKSIPKNAGREMDDTVLFYTRIVPNSETDYLLK